MMGIFQIFDRRRLRRKRISNESSKQETPSRASSINSTSCSSLSSHPAAPPLDFRDVVKDSMTNKEGLSPIKISPRKPPKKTHVDSPRPPPPAPPRSSLDSHTRPSSNLQDLPRWSLDSKQSSVHNSGSRPQSNLESRSFCLMKELAAVEPPRSAGVVAKLMGLEQLPSSPSLRPRATGANSTSLIELHEPGSNGRKNSTIRSTCSQRRSESPIVIIKPLNSTNRSMHLSSPCSSTSSSSLTLVGGPAKIRTQRGIDSGRDRGQLAKVSPMSPRTIRSTKENSPRINMVNASGSPRSPRLQQLSFEQAKTEEQNLSSTRRSMVKDQSSSLRARSPLPKKVAPLQQRNFDDRLTEISVNSVKSDVNARLISSPGRKCTELATILIHREKDVHECVRQEQPSPVSVLDFSPYGENSPSMNPSGVHGLVPEEEVMTHGSRLKAVDQLLQKLWRLSLSNHDDTDDDDDGDDPREDRRHPASPLVELNDPSHQYVYEILLASGFLGTGHDCRLSTAKIHKPDSVVDPGLFLVLEKSKQSKSKGEKLRRRLLFDAVNEALARKAQLAKLVDGRPTHGAQRGEHLLKELCMEIDRLNANHNEKDNAMKPMVCQHVARQSEDWVDFGQEASSIVLEIERSIFRDLIKEVINGEIATASTVPARFSRHRRRLLFS